MGRLTLNVLLSFAQFEREVTGERIRDKIAASRARACGWAATCRSATTVEARRSWPTRTRRPIVRLIFARYVELGCVASLKAELDARGIVSKARISATASTSAASPSAAARSTGCSPTALPRRGRAQGPRLSRRARRDHRARSVRGRAGHPERQPHHASQRYHADEPSLLGGLLVDARGRAYEPVPCGQEPQALSLLRQPGAAPAPHAPYRARGPDPRP